MTRSNTTALKKRWRSTPRPSLSDSVVRLLEAQLAAANVRERELLRQLAEKDAQIKMVLEDKFFKPVATEKPRIPENVFKANLEEDVVHFPTKGDAEAIEKHEEEEKKAREALEQSLNEELANIAESHRAYHEQHPELPAQAGLPSGKDLDVIAEEQRAAEATA